MITKREVNHIFNETFSNTRIASGIDKVSKTTLVKHPELKKEYVNSIVSALNGKCEYKFTKYKELLKVKDKDKKPRVISIPCYRDRLFFKVMYEKYLKSYADRKKFKDIISDVRKCVSSGKYDYAIKTDIESFFDSVALNILESVMVGLGIDKMVTKYSVKACKINTVNEIKNTKSEKAILLTKDKGIPQGLIISNILAELVAIEMDNYFDKLIASGAIYYNRFVDDILIFYNSSLINEKDLNDNIDSALKMFGLHRQKLKDKVYYVADGVSFLGFDFKGNIITVSKKAYDSKLKKIERVIFDFKNTKNKVIENNYKYLVWKLNLEITGFVDKETFYGWTSNYRFCNDYNIYRKLDYMVKTFYDRAKLDPKEFVNVKSFIKAHNDIKKTKKRKTSCIPVFSDIYRTTAQKKALLIDLFNIPKKTRSSYVIDMFNTLVKKEILSAERDLDLNFSL